jgi:PAS domain S-box-containing protein
MLEELKQSVSLQQAAQFYCQLVQAVESHAIFALSPEGQILSWNKGAERLKGYSADEAIGQFFPLLFTDEDVARKLPQQELAEAAAEGQFTGEGWRRRKDGSRFWASVALTALRDATGRVQGFLKITRDISDRLRVGEQLRYQLRVTGAITNNAAEGLCLLDATGRLTFMNPAAEELLGWRSAELLGRVLHDAVHHRKPDGTPFPSHECPLVEVLRAGTTVRNREDAMMHRDGHFVPVFCSCAPIMVEGEITGAVLALHDITERKQIEAALQEQTAVIETAERRSAFLAEASALLASSLDYETTLASVAQLAVPHIADWCAVHVIEREGLILPLAVAHANPSKVTMAEEAQRRYPIDPAETRGVPQVIRTGEPELYTDIPDALLTAAARDETHLATLRELQMRSAMIVPIMAQGRTLGALSFVSADSGRRYQAEDLTLAEDLARRAGLAIDNARLYREAQEANRIKDEFLATLSHELRTPLTAVLGWARLLSTGQLDAEASARALDTIQRNARAQQQIVEDILDVSRIITGKLRLEVNPVKLIPVIEAALESVRPAADAKAIRLEPRLDSATGLVMGDPARLQQVIWNLLSNAVKFTPQNGRIEVQLREVDSHAQVSISDSGEGIRAEFLPFVFDRFRQADGSTTRVHGGLGLGLAIVRHLVELHGGTVKAESAGEGNGATFIITLPLSVQKPESESASETDLPLATLDSESECLSDLSGLRVLVVDDEADSLEFLDASLTRCGAEVLTVSSAAEALDALTEFRPDVLISDIGMPHEDGYTLMRKIRALGPEHGGAIPAAAVTAYARSEDRMRALLAGFQTHIAKPVEPAELAAVVASLAGRTTQ